jgi:hypothetical protein
MRNDRQGNEAAGFTPWVQARCVWCGDVEFGLPELKVHTAADDLGLLEFACPSCDRVNVRPLGEPELVALATVGAANAPGTAPFELLEEHFGPPISWDDLIEFHEAVAGLDADTGWPRSLMEAGADAPARERDAA